MILENEKSNLEALINSTNDLIWSVNTECKLIASNKAFVAEMLQSVGVEFKPGDDLMVSQLFPEDFLAYWKTLYDRAFAGEAFIEEIVSPPTLHYTNTWSEIRFNPIYTGNTIIGAACFSRNISERKIAEETMRRVKPFWQKLSEFQKWVIGIMILERIN